MPKPRSRPPSPKASIGTIPGVSKRDLFFYQLGAATIQAQLPLFAGHRWVLAAPDEETRLLGEVSLELTIETLGPGTNAVAVNEHIKIVVGDRSTAYRANGRLPTNLRKLH